MIHTRTHTHTQARFELKCYEVTVDGLGGKLLQAKHLQRVGSPAAVQQLAEDRRLKASALVTISPIRAPASGFMFRERFL